MPAKAPLLIQEGPERQRRGWLPEPLPPGVVTGTASAGSSYRNRCRRGWLPEPLASGVVTGTASARGGYRNR